MAPHPHRTTVRTTRPRDHRTRLVVSGLVVPWSSLRQHFLHRNAAQLEEPANGVFDQIVRAGGAGGDADGDAAGWQPVLRFDFLMQMLVVMLNDFIRNHL